LPLGHCGHCTPCLIRRAAMAAAFGTDPTGYSLQDLASKPLSGRSAESEHVRSFQLVGRRLANAPGIEDIMVHKPGPLSDYPKQDIVAYAGVFRRGIEEVGKFLKGVVVKP
jgi:hypothetical protein